MRRLRRTARFARWWLLDYAYATVWQARAIANRVDPASFRSGGRTPVVVIPGVYETWRFLQPLIDELHSSGHPVHVVDALAWNRRPVIDAADRVARYLDEHDLRGVVLVTHSKGGLVGKSVMTSGTARVDAMIAVAAPFGGSSYARFLMLPSLRMFRPGDATILALAREQSVNARIVSVFGRFDPHIPGGSHLDGAKNVELDSGGHFRVLADPRVIAEAELLAR